MSQINFKNIGVFAYITYKNQILLVKKNYDNFKWTLPGGAVEKGENIEDALKREIMEETGLNVSSNLKFITVFYSILNYSLAFCFEVKSDGLVNNFKMDTIEISEVKFFNFENLPTLISKRTKKQINHYKRYRKSEDLISLIQYE